MSDACAGLVAPAVVDAGLMVSEALAGDSAGFKAEALSRFLLIWLLFPELMAGFILLESGCL